jgi:Outer membrane protein beta-barrel domain
MLRKIIIFALGFIGVAGATSAQQLPSMDFSIGYSYLREGFSNGVNANGGSFALTGYANDWLGITGDFGVYHASPFDVSANTYTYMAGPRFAYRKSSRVVPFAQTTFGGAHLTAGAGGVSASANGFAWSAGAGLDLGITPHIAFRPQFDYIGIHAAGSTLNTARVSAAIVFRFGLH